MTRVAGNGRAGNSGDGGPAIAAQLSFPAGIAADAAGNLYVADRDASVVRKVTLDGTISTVAGTGAAGWPRPGAPAAPAPPNRPPRGALRPVRNLFLAAPRDHP